MDMTHVVATCQSMYGLETAIHWVSALGKFHKHQCMYFPFKTQVDHLLPYDPIIMEIHSTYWNHTCIKQCSPDKNLSSNLVCTCKCCGGEYSMRLLSLVSEFDAKILISQRQTSHTEWKHVCFSEKIIEKWAPKKEFPNQSSTPKNTFCGIVRTFLYNFENVDGLPCCAEPHVVNIPAKQDKHKAFPI